jgi:hypothetical protein
MRHARFELLVAGSLWMASVGPARADEADDMLRELQASQASQASAPKESPATLRALVDETLPVVAKVMGLPAPRIELKVVTRAEASAKLLAVLGRDYPGDTLKRLGEALAAVGLVRESDNLAQAAHDMYATHVSGFYDPHDHVLYLITGQSMESQALIVAHELAHAVQDAAMPIEAATQRVRGSEDGQLALAAALEGQAQQVASLVMAQQLAASLGESAEGMADMLAEQTAGGASMAAQAPVPWLGMQMSFPYAAGAKLVAQVRRKDDPSARSLLKRLPASTAQVLEPARYTRDERPLSGSIDLQQKLPGSSLVYATTLGRANLDLLGQLHEQGELGAGWRGDRLEVVHVGGKTAAAWAVAFESAAQADALVKGWAAALHGKPAVPAVQADGSVYVAQRFDSVAVLLENVPPEQQAALQAAASKALR